MRFSDYHGPTGAYVALGDRVVPLASVQGAVALGYSAMLSSVPPGEKARRWEEGMRRALEEARRVDEAREA